MHRVTVGSHILRLRCNAWLGKIVCPIVCGIIVAIVVFLMLARVIPPFRFIKRGAVASRRWSSVPWREGFFLGPEFSKDGECLPQLLFVWDRRVGEDIIRQFTFAAMPDQLRDGVGILVKVMSAEQ